MNTYSKGDIKVGDKFVIEIGEIIPDKNGKLLYKIKGFNALVFDDVGINKLNRYETIKPEWIFKAWENGFDIARAVFVSEEAEELDTSNLTRDFEI